MRKYFILLNVVGVTKMGNIVPRVRIEPLTFQVSVLIITPPRLPDVITLPKRLLV